MQWSTTTSLNDLHIIDDANNIVRWHRMSQCPVCLQPIPYDERRIVAGKILHSGCIICVECHKSIGDGTFEQYDEDILCVNCYKIKLEPASSPIKSNENSPKKDEILVNNNNSPTNSATRYASMKSFTERVHLYNEYNLKKTSNLTITEKDGKIRVSGMLRIYWNINTPINLKSGQSIPLGLYPKSLGIYEMNEEKLNNEIGTDQQQLKNTDSIHKRSCYDDTILTKLSLTDENDSNQFANLRRVQTIRMPSNQRKILRVSLPTFIQSSNTDDDETRLFIPAKDSMTTVYIDSETTVQETISLLFSKHFIEESNSNLFTLYKVERQNGNCIEMSDDDYPLILRILAGPFENDIFFYLMEHGKSKNVPLEVSNYLVLPDLMLRAFIEKFSYEEIENIHTIKRKYLAYKQLLLRQFEIAISE